MEMSQSNCNDEGSNITHYDLFTFQFFLLLLLVLGQRQWQWMTPNGSCYAHWTTHTHTKKKKKTLYGTYKCTVNNNVLYKDYENYCITVLYLFYFIFIIWFSDRRNVNTQMPGTITVEDVNFIRRCAFFISHLNENSW